MPLKRSDGANFSDTTIFKRFDGVNFIDASLKRFDGSIWNELTQIVRVYSATASRSFNDGTKQGANAPHFVSHPYNAVSINKWASDTGLAQGRYSNGSYNWWYPEVYLSTAPVPLSTYDGYSAGTFPCYGINFGGTVTIYDGPWFGLFGFSSGAGKPTELAGKTIDSARIRLYRYDTGGSSGDVDHYLYATDHTSVPGANATSPHAAVVGSANFICTLGRGEGGWFTLPVALAAYVVAGKCLCLYNGNNNSTRLYGIENASYKPQIEITCH
jgi:hypothetical protein